MAGTYTQTRDVGPPSPFSYQAVVSGVPKHGNFGFGAPKQTTTSYRSGGEVGLASHEDTAFDEVTNSSGVFKALREDAKVTTRGDRTHDTGHPFDTTKEFAPVVSLSKITLTAGTRSYTGPLVPAPAFATSRATSSTWERPIPGFDQGYYGPKAISATIPTNPVADLAVTLGELYREGLPALLGAQALKRDVSAARKAGGEYLNVEFGWKPLIAGIADTMTAIALRAQHLRQLQRDSGRWVRRGYVFPEEKSIQSYAKVGSIGHMTRPPNLSATDWAALLPVPSGSLRVTEDVRTNRKVWFRGAYSYYLQTGNSQLDRMFAFEEKANKLLGVRITPEVVWNLAPWSWLADWHGNVGHNLANASMLSQDGLVIRYGYLMCTTEVTHTYSVDGLKNAQGRSLPSATVSFKTVRKQRVKAYPYGFGSDPATYTARQWSILAALGMTRSPKSLR